MVLALDHRHTCQTLNQLIFKIAEKKTLDLDSTSLNKEVKDFISFCCVFDRRDRPSISKVLKHEFLN